MATTTTVVSLIKRWRKHFVDRERELVNTTAHGFAVPSNEDYATSPRQPLRLHWHGQNLSSSRVIRSTRLRQNSHPAPDSSPLLPSFFDNPTDICEEITQLEALYRALRRNWYIFRRQIIQKAGMAEPYLITQRDDTKKEMDEILEERDRLLQRLDQLAQNSSLPSEQRDYSDMTEDR